LTLKEFRIDSNLANIARRTFAMPQWAFNEMIAKGRGEVKRSVERAAESKAKALQ
jgi:hypothetical protein